MEIAVLPGRALYVYGTGPRRWATAVAWRVSGGGPSTRAAPPGIAALDSPAGSDSEGDSTGWPTDLLAGWREVPSPTAPPEPRLAASTSTGRGKRNALRLYRSL